MVPYSIFYLNLNQALWFRNDLFPKEVYPDVICYIWRNGWSPGIDWFPVHWNQIRHTPCFLFCLHFLPLFSVPNLYPVVLPGADVKESKPDKCPIIAECFHQHEPTWLNTILHVLCRRHQPVNWGCSSLSWVRSPCTTCFNIQVLFKQPAGWLAHQSLDFKYVISNCSSVLLQFTTALSEQPELH